MKRHTTLMILLAFFTAPPAAAWCSTLPATPPAGLTTPPVSPQVRETRVRMSDGVELATDVFLPSATGAHPVIVMRTPYGKRGKRLFAEKFVAAGYAVVLQDVRGKWGSGGSFIPFVNEEKDGIETLDWIAGEEWSNGRVATFGASYLAHAGLLLARHGHPSLQTVFSASGWIGADRMNEPGGAFHMMLGIPWLIFNQGQTHGSLRDVDLDALFHQLPLSRVLDSIGMNTADSSEHGVLRAYAGADLSKASIPMFHLTGWYDFVAPASLEVWRSLQKVSDRAQPLVVGPWIHDQLYTSETGLGEIDAGSESILGIDGLTRLAIDWFDCQLRERCSEIAPVRVFVLGENRWREFGEWPPRESRRRSLHLGSRGRAATTLDDGTLSNAPPRRPGTDRFTFDPASPVPTVGGANFHFFPETTGPRDQREIERRPDVAVYTTSALETALLLAGPIRTILHVSTSGRDTDFTAKLSVVSPEGRSLSIADGIIRLSARNGHGKRELVEPGKIYEVAIDMSEIAMKIDAGSRLRLAISSSNFPKFNRNPNSGDDPLEATMLATAQQTIHHSAARPSRIELTVIGSAERAPRRPLKPAKGSPVVVRTVADPEVVRAGIELLEAGHFAAAKEHFERYLSGAPGAAQLHYWLGRSLLAAKGEGAIAAIERAVELDPLHADAHLWLARAQIEKLQSASGFQQALLAGSVRRSLEKAVELEPENLEARSTLAGYYLNAPGVAGGSMRKAREQIAAIVAIDPNRGHLLMAGMHVGRKEWLEAEAAFRRALEVEPHNAEVHYQMGRMYQDQEKWREASASFESAVAADPEHALSWYQLGRNGALSGDGLERALEALERYTERYAAAGDPAFRSGSWWRKGMVHEKLGQPEKAIDAYERAVELDPAHQQASMALARLRQR
jgi:uncharacterized protein